MSSEPPTGGPGPAITPVYNEDTNRLERLTSDRNGDGKVDTWAYMDGRVLRRIDIDRDADDVVDRVEHYLLPPNPDPRAPLGGVQIATVEESAGPDRLVVRREQYEAGVLDRVEEDSDADGRMDRWEEHVDGRLYRVTFDLHKRGIADRRMTYAGGGVLVEMDPDGDGTFEPVPATEVQPVVARRP
jgi:hypothetical protein